jgi:hypothetical protein
MPKIYHHRQLARLAKHGTDTNTEADTVANFDQLRFPKPMGKRFLGNSCDQLWSLPSFKTYQGKSFLRNTLEDTATLAEYAPQCTFVALEIRGVNMSGRHDLTTYETINQLGLACVENLESLADFTGPIRSAGGAWLPRRALGEFMMLPALRADARCIDVEPNASRRKEKIAAKFAARGKEHREEELQFGERYKIDLINLEEHVVSTLEQWKVKNPGRRMVLVGRQIAFTMQILGEILPRTVPCLDGWVSIDQLSQFRGDPTFICHQLMNLGIRDSGRPRDRQWKNACMYAERTLAVLASFIEPKETEVQLDAAVDDDSEPVPEVSVPSKL